jgi:hypothetical protein
MSQNFEEERVFLILKHHEHYLGRIDIGLSN